MSEPTSLAWERARSANLPLITVVEIALPQGMTYFASAPHEGGGSGGGAGRTFHADTLLSAAQPLDGGSVPAVDVAIRRAQIGVLEETLEGGAASLGGPWGQVQRPFLSLELPNDDRSMSRAIGQHMYPHAPVAAFLTYPGVPLRESLRRSVGRVSRVTLSLRACRIEAEGA